MNTPTEMKPSEGGPYWVKINGEWLCGLLMLSRRRDGDLRSISVYLFGNHYPIAEEDIEEFGEKIERQEPVDLSQLMDSPNIRVVQREIKTDWTVAPEWCQNPKQQFDVYG
jgi:hypothetical protein